MMDYNENQKMHTAMAKETARTATPLEKLNERMQNTMHTAAELSARLESVADKLFGGVPETDRAGRGPSEHFGDGHIGDLHRTQDNVDEQMKRLAYVVGRLSAL